MHPIWNSSSTNTIKRGSVKCSPMRPVHAPPFLCTTYNVKEIPKYSAVNDADKCIKNPVFTLETLFGSSQNTSMDGASTNGISTCSLKAPDNITKSEATVATNNNEELNSQTIHGSQWYRNQLVQQTPFPANTSVSLPKLETAIKAMPEESYSEFVSDIHLDLRTAATISLGSRRTGTTYDNLSLSTYSGAVVSCRGKMF